MLYLSTFINNIINQLIRNLSMEVRITISVIFIFIAIMSLKYLMKSYSKDVSKLKYGWLVLALVSMLISVLYIVL